jgi:hypothetical protein
MKKSFLFMFILLFGVTESFSQRTTTAPEIDEFLASPEFNRIISDPTWRGLGSVNRSLSYATPIPDSKNEVAVTIIFQDSRNSKVIAVIEAVKAPDAKYLFPGNEKYAIVLRNYENYNFSNTTGVIDYYDLNYKNHHAGTITVSKSSIVSWVTYDIPDEILNQDSQVIKKAHYCDKNQNGNVTFSECYKCMKDACSSDAGCDTLCDILNLYHGWCTASIGTACIFISMAW